MTVKKSGAKWYVVKKGGALGKRGFSSEATAKSAQSRGKSLAKASGFTKGGGSRSSGGGGAGAGGSSSKSSNMTVGKALDLFALGGGAIRNAAGYAETGNIGWLTGGLPEMYTGYHPINKTFKFEQLTKGYGGSINRVFEKKLLKFLRIRGPRTKVKTAGDVIDWATYFGASGLAAWENKDSPQAAIEEIYHIQNGIDFDLEGYGAWKPGRMLKEKIGPYVAQKYIRKLLRWGGIKFSFS